MLRKYLNNKGFVLLYVLEIILLLTMISTAVLVVAYSSTRQSLKVEKHEQTYYEAESILNIAEAVFTSEINIPKTGYGESKNDAIDDLFNQLQTSLSDAEIMVTNEIGDLGTDVEVSLEFPENYEDYIMAEKFKVDGSEWISFFGGGEGDAVASDSDTFEIIETLPFKYTISATIDNRMVQITRDYTIAGATFTPASNDDGGLRISGEYLINGISSWLATLSISCPQGLTINDNPPERPSMLYPGNNLHEYIYEPIQAYSEQEAIRILTYNIIQNNLGDRKYIHVANWADTQTIRPSDMVKGDGTYYKTIYSDTADIILVGDFSEIPLLAVHGQNRVILGNNTEAFSCDKSSASEPLYIYSPGETYVNYYGYSVISNAIIGTPNTLYINGNTDEYVYCDAQFYSNNAVNVGVKDGTPLTVNNWDVKGVPTFISSNVTNVNVKAKKGFSGIFYSLNNPSINVDASKYNGAFLLNGVNPMKFSNTLNEGDPVEFYCEINETTSNYLHQTIVDYFESVAEQDPTAVEVLTGEAKYNTIDDEGNIIYQSIKNPATISELTQ